jgi:hypothetical protein
MASASGAKRALLVLSVASVALLAALAPAQAATTSKPYAVSISPLALPAGAALSRDGLDPVEVTVTNQAGIQSIQSVEIGVPSGVSLTGAGPAGGSSPEISGGKARWLNQSIAPGTSQTYTLDVQAPCAGTLGSWTVIPKQSNDFRGPPGNTFGPLDPSSVLAASLQGACTLTWTAAPADARIQARVSTTDFDPAGPAPAVTLRDGANQGISGQTVTVGLGPSSGVGTLAAPVSGTTDASGVAKFENVAITSAGYYRLAATTLALTAVTPESFLIQTTDQLCESGCSGSTTGEDGSKLSVTVNPGTYPGGRLSMSVLGASLDLAPDCRDYVEFSGEFSIVVGPGGDKTISQTITKQDMNRSPNNGASFINVCYGDLATTEAFEQALGDFGHGDVVPATGWWFDPVTVAAGTEPQAWDFDGDGIPDGIIWVLADCRTTGDVRPCEDATSKDRAGNGVVTYLAPGGLLDPYGRG